MRVVRVNRARSHESKSCTMVASTSATGIAGVVGPVADPEQLRGRGGAASTTLLPAPRHPLHLSLPPGPAVPFLGVSSATSFEVPCDTERVCSNVDGDLCCPGPSLVKAMKKSVSVQAAEGGSGAGCVKAGAAGELVDGDHGAFVHVLVDEPSCAAQAAGSGKRIVSESPEVLREAVDVLRASLEGGGRRTKSGEWG